MAAKPWREALAASSQALTLRPGVACQARDTGGGQWTRLDLNSDALLEEEGAAPDMQFEELLQGAGPPTVASRRLAEHDASHAARPRTSSRTDYMERVRACRCTFAACVPAARQQAFGGAARRVAKRLLCLSVYPLPAHFFGCLMGSPIISQSTKSKVPRDSDPAALSVQRQKHGVPLLIYNARSLGCLRY